MHKLSKHTILTIGILAGLIFGGVVGQVMFTAYGGNVPTAALEGFKFIGDTFFIGLLKMVLIPLVVSSVIVGVATIGDPSQLGRVGGWTVLYYLCTMVIAVVLGVFLVTTVAPGDPNRDGSGIGPEVIAKGEAAYGHEGELKRQRIEKKAEAGRHGVAGALWESFRNIAKQLIPANPIGAAAKGQILPVIAFSLILGIVLTSIGARGQPLIDVFRSLFAAIMKLVDWILWLAPMGVFCLVTWTVARLGGEELLRPLAKYMVVVVAGLLVHGLIVLPLVLWVFGRTNPYVFICQMREALMTAFGTDSSSATLPVTMECAEQLGGVSKKSAGFVLPLGATINMDGTALYEAVAVVFLFQCYGIELGTTELAVIVVTATLAAVGAAGIPSAGLVTMVIVVEAVNNSLGGDKTLPLAAVGIIIGVDRILDMCRTTVNVWGDAVGAKIITRIAPDPG
ncbi:MAG: sodium:dicarboxylate symporter [Phycisphaeraceae bacterium]|nr:sodium:dicarboxylate symporter [Phycisphaeraceae bacterium]|tara:strand:- start:2048 stop:3403 length:1356 start_codon:yes stop_codon:yes gene_type:complete